MPIPLRAILLMLSVTVPVCGEDARIRVAVFQGAGVGSSCEKLIAALQSAVGKFEVIRVTAEEIRGGQLAEVDVLVHPGGSGSKQGKALGENGRQVVREFVDAGGGYLGVCAGAYLATNHYDWSLKLIDAKVVDRLHWARGKGTVSVQLSPTGSELFEDDDRELTLHYG